MEAGLFETGVLVLSPCLQPPYILSVRVMAACTVEEGWPTNASLSAAAVAVVQCREQSGAFDSPIVVMARCVGSCLQGCPLDHAFDAAPDAPAAGSFWQS